MTGDQLGARAKGKDACDSDSGGPLTVRNASDSPILVGVVSYGGERCASRSPGMYARVASFASFITLTTGMK